MLYIALCKCRNRAGCKFTKRDIEVVRRSAQRMVDVINESKKLAKTSKNPSTKVSRFKVARDKLEELKNMTHQYPFLSLPTLNEFEKELSDIALEIQQGGYVAIANANEAGQQLERDGLIDEAIPKYERLIAKAVDTPFTYRRLAIIYRKKKMVQDELKVLKEAIKNIPVSNTKHFEWFEDRYKKTVLKVTK